ncbi:MAG: 16S rRNA (cytidine(1402)-2'-O)-methyltransferase [Thermoanaerobaculia bacterium]
MSGTLYILATPIGNLEDLSSRAVRCLEQADLVACEDTRRTGRLLQHLGLKKRLLSFHEHNERQRTAQVLEHVVNGKAVVLVSDAGTPLLSDPGYTLVREAARQNIAIEHVAGPSAVTAAIVLSALPPYPFTFLGFPPPRRGKRRNFYARIQDLGHTVVLFESPQRLISSLEDALEILGDRPAAVARELTKLHEEVLRGTLSALIEQLGRRQSVKGEVTVVIALQERI